MKKVKEEKKERLGPGEKLARLEMKATMVTLVKTDLVGLTVHMDQWVRKETQGQEASQVLAPFKDRKVLMVL